MIFRRLTAEAIGLTAPSAHSSSNSNRACWDRKRETNMARDRHITRQLRGRGWKVIRIWQHSLQKSPAACLNRIRPVVGTLSAN
jgi:G:T-mismatch repair DNA endonuclease (very short patch repair protein)